MKFKITIGAIALAAMSLGFASGAQAVPITFEGVPNTIYGAPITRLGFDIGNPIGDEQHFHEIDSTAFPTFVPNNGTGVLYNDRDTRIFVDANPAGAVQTFSLASVDVATDLNGGAGGATLLTISGFLNNLPTGTLVVPISGVYTTVSGAPLGLVDRLLFDGNSVGNGGFTLDNLNVTTGVASVPAPGSLALIGFALAGLTVMRRLRFLHRPRS